MYCVVYTKQLLHSNKSVVFTVVSDRHWFVRLFGWITMVTQWYSTVLNKPARAPALTHSQHVLLMFTCCRYTCMVGHLTAPCLFLSLSYTCHSLVTRSSATASHFVYVNPYTRRLYLCVVRLQQQLPVCIVRVFVCVVSYHHYQFVLRG